MLYMLDRLLSAVFHYLYTTCIEYDYVPLPTEAPHRYGNLPSGDPITTENSAYGLRDSQEEEQLSKCM